MGRTLCRSINGVPSMLKLSDEVLHDVAEKANPKECITLVVQLGMAMEEFGGVGLAAPQVGISERVIVFKENGCTRAMINPVIVKHRGDKRPAKEGCLSFPDASVRVKRWYRITVEFEDVNGTEHCQTYTGKTARIVQHEIDHLNGVTIV